MDRLSNFELLRVISMLGIVIFHMFFHGNYNVEIDSVNNAFIRYIQVLGEVGVNVFVLITGYFFSSKTKSDLNYKKIIKFIFLLAFYSFFLAVFTAMCKLTDISSLSMFLITIIPDKWWFSTTYLLLLLLIPILNCVLRNSNKLFLEIIVLCGYFFLCIIPTILGRVIINNFLLANVTWFSFLFMIAGYVKFYEEDFCVSSKNLVYSIIIFGLVEIIVTSYLLNKYSLPMFGNNVPYYYDRYYFPTLVLSVLIFLLFKNISIYSFWINRIATVTIDVYLISDYPVIRELLWINVFNLSRWQYEWYLIPLSLSITILVYCGCSFLGVLRIAIFNLFKMN